MTSKPVIARLKDGSEFGFETERAALKLHPDAKIVGHQDGSPIEAPVANDKPADKPEAKKAD